MLFVVFFFDFSLSLSFFFDDCSRRLTSHARHRLTIDFLRQFDSNHVLNEHQLRFILSALQERKFFGSRSLFVTELLLADANLFEGGEKSWIALAMATSVEPMLPPLRRRRRRLTAMIRHFFFNRHSSGSLSSSANDNLLVADTGDGDGLVSEET